MQVPYEKCELLPDLDCQFVLKAVPVEECKPTVKQDCRDEARQKPYLEEEEECFEVIYDECFLVRPYRSTRDICRIIGTIFVPL